jgi:hypothetical protein
MGKAILVFEDTPDGHIQMLTTFEGGYDHNSQAHKTAGVAINHLDRLAAAEGQKPQHFPTAGMAERSKTQQAARNILELPASALR